jgi:hypothetical protein
MKDDKMFDTILDLLKSLLDHPAPSWDREGLDDLRLELECGEYEGSLTNRIAMGLQSKAGFHAAQVGKLNTLIGLMNLEGSQWVIKLRQYERDKQTTSNGENK